MEIISHSMLTFLLNALWQIPVVASVAALAGWITRDGPAGYRHAIYVAALLAALGLPLASIQSHASTTASYKLPAPAIEASHTTAGPHALPLSQPKPAHSRTQWSVSFASLTAGTLLFAYLFFLIFQLARLIAALVRTIRIRREAAPVTAGDAVQQAWDQTRDAFNISGVQLLASKNVDAPVMMGLRRKAIILPQRLLAESSGEVLLSAIGHEMAHVARHDFAANLLYEILNLPIAFHPASWLIRRQIDRTRELACDELVTSRLISPGAYARAIVSIARTMTALPHPGYTLGDPNNL